jgi:hypothetical protein
MDEEVWSISWGEKKVEMSQDGVGSCPNNKERISEDLYLIGCSSSKFMLNTSAGRSIYENAKPLER